MKWLETARALNASAAMRTTQLIGGAVLVVAAPLVGLLPGPGGLIIFGIGLGLILRNSRWAKRRYVAFKRVQPKIGGWADWGMRRASARRRRHKIGNADHG